MADKEAGQAAAPGGVPERLVDWVPRVTLRQLTYFVTVAQFESVTRAAAELHVSAPSISAALSELESLVGAQLFVRRHARGLLLTSTGRSLVIPAREILMNARDFQSRRSADGSGVLEGMIDFGCLVSFAPYTVPALVREFYEHHPKVRIRWREEHHAGLVASLEEGTIDCALTYDFDIPTSVHCTEMRRMPLQIVIPSNHRLATRAELSLRELGDAPFVLLDLPRTRDYLLSVFAQCGIEPRIVHRARSFEMVRGLVANGFGYTLLNFCPPHGDGDLVSLPMTEHVGGRSLVFARRYSYKMPRLVEEFMSHIGDFIARQTISAAPHADAGDRRNRTNAQEQEWIQS